MASIVNFFSNSMIKLSILILLSVLNLDSFAQTPAQQMPDFKFQKLDGKIFTKSQLNNGKNTLIFFFDATCEHCQRTAKTFNANTAKFKNINVVMISMDVPKGIETFLEIYAPALAKMKNVTVLQDDKNDFVYSFHPIKFPSIYVYNATGHLILYHDSDQGLDEVFNAIKKGR